MASFPGQPGWAGTRR